MSSLPEPNACLYQITPYSQGKTARDPSAVPIKLSANENPYGPSPKAIEACAKAAQHMHRYPDGACYELREALGDKHRLPMERLVCGAGSDELIGLLVNAYAGPGDEVMFTEHAFLMYKIYTMAAGATPVAVAETNLKANIDALIEAVTERTKILFIANPNNPTGSYLTQRELASLRRRLPDRVLLVVDGAYAECASAGDYDSGRELALNTNNTVMLRTFSKIYGLPAMRLGWMLASDTIIDAINRIRSPFNVSQPAQAAGMAALRDVSWFNEQYRRNLEQRAWVIHRLRTSGLYAHDSQGNFTLVDCGTADNASALIRSLETQHIYVRQMDAYGLPHCMRVSIGMESENRQFVEAVERHLS